MARPIRATGSHRVERAATGPTKCVPMGTDRENAAAHHLIAAALNIGQRIQTGETGMKAAVFVAPGEPLAIDDVPDPSPAPGELLIAVRSCGICGTDLHWSEQHDTAGGWRALHPGGVLGHEFCGEVVDVGAGVGDAFRIGERVCAQPFIGCGRCQACLSGRIYRCPTVITRGSSALPGAYAEFTRVGAAESVRLPESMELSHGALVEPLAVGLAAVERARLDAHDAVLIIGAGPVGLSIALWCRFAGARHVVVSDLVAERAERAVQFGATAWIDASAGRVDEQLADLTGGAPPVVFECVGVPGTLQAAIDAVAADGCVIVAGLCMGADSLFPAKAFLKALDLRFSFCYEHKHFNVVVDHLASGRIDVSDLITARVGFAQFADTFEHLKQPGHELKVLLEPR